MSLILLNCGQKHILCE